MSRKSHVSAGLLVYRAARELEVLLAHPGGPYWAKKDAGAWTIPKGLADANEDILATALREFSEETGFAANPPFLPLSPVKQRSGKTVHGFACTGNFDPERLDGNTFELEWPPKSRRRMSFPEIDRIAWFGIATAREKILTYQRPFLDELERLLARDHGPDGSA